MKRNSRLGSGILAIMAAAMFVAGCGPADKGGAAKDQGKDKTAAREKAAHDDDNKGHDHSGWWCDEHGVPEEVCGQCNGKLAAELKKKGDWCNDHDRPKSQCFKCDPKLREKFAAQYRAKYGKEPPPIEDDEKKG